MWYIAGMKKFFATKNASVRENLKGDISRGMLGKIKQNGEVFLNGEKCKLSQIARVNDEIVVVLPNRKKESVVPFFCDIEVLFEDDDIIVLNKPSGMPTHTSKGNFESTLENAYCGMCSLRGDKIENFTFHPITRLDSETSGAVLVCKNAIATAKVSRDMQNGKIKKEYLALVSGEIERDFETVLYMDRLVVEKPQRWQKDDGKYSETKFEIVRNIGENTLVKALPKTGRTHQIRVHLAFCGHCIVGDKLYQNGGILQGEKPKERLKLHMAKLEFLNMKDEKVIINCECDFVE